jgi:hypothetical protein
MIEKGIYDNKCHIDMLRLRTHHTLVPFGKLFCGCRQRDWAKLKRTAGVKAS